MRSICRWSLDIVEFLKTKHSVCRFAGKTPLLLVDISLSLASQMLATAQDHNRWMGFNRQWQRKHFDHFWIFARIFHSRSLLSKELVHNETFSCFFWSIKTTELGTDLQQVEGLGENVNSMDDRAALWLLVLNVSLRLFAKRSALYHFVGRLLTNI